MLLLMPTTDVDVDSRALHAAPRAATVCRHLPVPLPMQTGCGRKHPWVCARFEARVRHLAVELALGGG